MRKTIKVYFGDGVWLDLDYFDLQKLKKLHSKAELKGQESFTFKNLTVLRDYGKYIIDYLDGKFY